MADPRPYPPWWQDRYDWLDDQDLGYDPRDDPASDDFEPWVEPSVDPLDVEPRVDCWFDEQAEDRQVRRGLEA